MAKYLPYIVTTLTVLIIIIFGGWAFSTLTAPKNGEIITAKVTLNNDCSITDDAFLLFIPRTGRRMAFANGVIHVTVKTGEPLRLITSSAYPKVKYEGYDEVAARRVTMTVQCNPSDYENLLNKPMRDRFGD